MELSKRSRVLKLIHQQGGVARPRDLDAIGVSREYLNHLYQQGILDRPSRGLYTLADQAPSEHQSLLEVTRRVPGGVICLLTALQFHELTTESPFEVWLAIGHKDRLPRLDYPPIRVVRFSGAAFEYGVINQQLGSTSFRVYTAAKTVADCFKFRNKIGLEIALSALKDCLRQRKASRDEIWQAAKVCRMTNVLRPYLEATV